jgi:spore coat polysaccharide biosynthesis protein SpsF
MSAEASGAGSQRRLAGAFACRAGGTRLYGKPLQNLDIQSRTTVLDHLIDLISTVPVVDEIVIGVSVGAVIEPFHDIARAHGLKSIRGDETDVLGRLVQCGVAAGATDVFRITTESPFIYFEPIEDAWRRHLEHDNDVTTIAGLPDGPGFEIIKLAALQESHDKGDSRHRSELCTLYIKEHQDEFQVEVLEAPPGVDRNDLRLTIDYPEDLVLCRRIYEHFRDLAPRIPLAQICAWIDANPESHALVAPYVSGGRWYR